MPQSTGVSGGKGLRGSGPRSACAPSPQQVEGLTFCTCLCLHVSRRCLLVTEPELGPMRKQVGETQPCTQGAAVGWGDWALTSQSSQSDEGVSCGRRRLSFLSDFPARLRGAFSLFPSCCALPGRGKGRQEWCGGPGTGSGAPLSGYTEQEALPGQGRIDDSAVSFGARAPILSRTVRFRERGRLIRWVPGSAGPCRQQMALARGSLQRIY